MITVCASCGKWLRVRSPLMFNYCAGCDIPDNSTIKIKRKKATVKNKVTVKTRYGDFKIKGPNAHIMAAFYFPEAKCTS